MNIRRAIVLAALSIGISAGAGAPATHAAGLKTYHSSLGGFSLQYPATWKLTVDSKTDLATLRDPGKYCYIWVAPIKEQVTMGQLIPLQVRALKLLGQPAGKLTTRQTSIDGVPFEISEQMVRGHQGFLLDGLIVDGIRAPYVYDFTIALSDSSAVAPMQHIVNSFVVTK